MADNQRLQGVDALKGIAIIGVVFAHLVLLGGLNREGEGELPVIMQVIDLGLMAFFIITGYFYRPERGFIGQGMAWTR